MITTIANVFSSGRGARSDHMETSLKYAHFIASSNIFVTGTVIPNLDNGYFS